MRPMLALLLVACGSSEPSGVVPQSKAEAPAVYDVHEWGLLDATLRSERIELSAGPGTNAPAMGLGLRGVGKPILYVHVVGKRDEFDLDVGVELDDAMTIAEHFPPGQLDDSRRQIRWSTHVRRAPCEGERTYPTTESSVCQGLPDDYCEAAELAGYETDDASCLQVGQQHWPMLFYRGAQHEDGQIELPIEVRRDDDGTIHVTNRSTAQPIGRLWRVRRSATASFAVAVDWPAAGATTTLSPANEAGAIDQAHGMIEADIRAHGLTEAEARAFDDAWHEALFGPRPETAVRGTGRGGGGVGGGLIGLGNVGTIGRGGGGLGYGAMPPGTVFDGLLYWLPAESFEDIASLQLDPPPREVHRVMLVRVDLVH